MGCRYPVSRTWFSPHVPLRAMVCHGGASVRAGSPCPFLSPSLPPCRPAPPGPAPSGGLSGLGLQPGARHSSTHRGCPPFLSCLPVVKLWQKGQLGCHLCLRGSWHLGRTSETCRCGEGHVTRHLSPGPPLPTSPACTPCTHWHQGPEGRWCPCTERSHAIWESHWQDEG